MREVICDDAIDWLHYHEGLGPVITSPPDMVETGHDVEAWRAWFRLALHECIWAAGEYPAVFYVTDRRHKGRLLSKANMVLNAAQRTHREVMWHKIALRMSPGAVSSHRPSYVHVIAVGLPGTPSGWPSRLAPANAVADVFDAGPRLYQNGMGAQAARVAVSYVQRFGGTVVNPFCGHGTVLAAADEYELDSVGIDIDERACVIAQEAVLP